MKAFKQKITLVLAVILVLSFFSFFPLFSVKTQAKIILEPQETIADYLDRDYLVIDKLVPTAFGRIYKFLQVYQGVEVFSRGLNVSVNSSDEVLSVAGNILEGIDISIEPEIMCEGELVIFSIDYPATLSFMQENDNERIFIDASNGQEITRILVGSSVTFGGSSVQTTQTDYYGEEQEVSVERASSGTYYLSDATRNIYLYNANNREMLFTNNYITSTTSTFNNSVAVSTFLSVQAAFDFYADESNTGVAIRGINDSVDYVRDNADSKKEMAVRVYMHYGRNYENAYYTGLPKTQNFISLVFGDGNASGVLYNPSVAKDIVAHEYQHAITDYISGLIYENASGALNEAYSDIFGALVEGYELTDDRFWAIGENATPSSFGLRSMKNPLDYDMPIHTDEQYPFSSRPSDANDYGGVHINNSILTHSQYKMWEMMPEHFTKQNIGMLWYTALGMLSSSASFESFAVAMLESARLLGWSDEVLLTINECFNSSGIETPPLSIDEPDEPEPDEPEPDEPEPDEPEPDDEEEYDEGGVMCGSVGFDEWTILPPMLLGIGLILLKSRKKERGK